MTGFESCRVGGGAGDEAQVRRCRGGGAEEEVQRRRCGVLGAEC